jgi:hypothetical protein
MTPWEDDQADETDIRFQEAHGARLFRQGKPRAVLEVKSPDIPAAFYEARLRGYDEAKAAKESAPTKTKAKAQRLRRRSPPLGSDRE